MLDEAPAVGAIHHDSTAADFRTLLIRCLKDVANP
jgi:hypothetical protein